MSGGIIGKQNNLSVLSATGIWDLRAQYNNRNSDIWPRGLLLTYKTSLLSSTNSVTIPSTVVEGDILVLYDRVISTNITTVIPSGFTQIANVTNSTDRRTIVSYKVASSSDANQSITGLNGTNSSIKMLTVFGTGVLTPILTVGGILSSAYTDADPTPLTVDVSATSAPLIVMATFGCSSAITTTSSVATTITEASVANQVNRYKLYQTGESMDNIQFDMNDGGTANQFSVFYIKVS